MPSGFRIDWLHYDDVIRKELPLMTIEEFTKTYLPDFSSHAVGARARKLGVRPAKFQPTADQLRRIAGSLSKETPELVHRIREMRDSTSLSRIAKQLDISYATLTRIIKRHNIQISLGGKRRAIEDSKCKLNDPEDGDLSDPWTARRLRAKWKRRASPGWSYERSMKHRESSVERFLKYKLLRIEQENGPNGQKVTASGLPRPKHEVAITLNDLIDLWHCQQGRCAISSKKMEHKRCLFAVSIDRINSHLGYISGNVQLVCQAINMAKNRYSNEDMIHFWHKDSL